MEEVAHAIPDRIEDLRTLVASLGEALERERREKEYSIRALAETRILLEREQAKYEDLRREIFGPKSEKHSEGVSGQGELFDEAERDSAAVSEPSMTVLVKRRIGKRRGRKRPGIELERIEQLHDLEESEKRCPCCGKDRPRIGEERSEEVEIVPARAYVTVHVRPKYGPCGCTAFEASGAKKVVMAPSAKRIVPGSAFSNRSIAFFIVAKYVDAIPFYRQEKVVGRFGLSVGRGTMAHLAIKVAQNLEGVLTLMLRDIRGSPAVGMDETVVQVLKEPGRKASSESRMWVARGYREEKPILIFSYDKSRSGAVAQSILGDFVGYLQTDGYAGYDAVGKRIGIIHVGCWAHIRRKFHNVYLSQEKSPLAREMIMLIRELYSIETRLRDLLKKRLDSQEEFLAGRKAETGEVFKKIDEWLHATMARVSPGSPLGIAISYALGQFERAKRYVDHHLLTPDNNLLENAIRPFVVGRKNWLFYDTPHGAWAGATLYSLIETARANGHEPYRYLCHLFEKLPYAKTEDAIRTLLPYELKPETY